MTTRLALLPCLLAALVLPALGARPVAGQTMPCAPRERMLDIVIDRLGEMRQATGTAGRGAEVELFAGPEGSWTILLHLPDGRSCLMANGTGFQATGGLQPARGRPT
jgi:hypothetical protein